jgi:hypothetical protein
VLTNSVTLSCYYVHNLSIVLDFVKATFLSFSHDSHNKQQSFSRRIEAQWLYCHGESLALIITSRSAVKWSLVH